MEERTLSSTLKGGFTHRFRYLVHHKRLRLAGGNEEQSFWVCLRDKVAWVVLICGPSTNAIDKKRKEKKRKEKKQKNM